MDGFQLCLKCKENEKLKNIPFILATSSYTDKSDEQFSLKLGADGFIMWPMGPAETLKAVNEVLEKIKKEGVVPHRALDASSVEFLKGYNERVVRQLESKMMELEADITKRKKVEEELKKRLGELEVFYKSAMDREDMILELKNKVKGLENKN